jgi:hypothetical protein
MQGKILFAVGLGLGYVLGARQGRGRYEKLKRQASDVWQSGTVQRGVADAQKLARENVPVVGDKIADVVEKVKSATGANESAPADNGA